MNYSNGKIGAQEKHRQLRGYASTPVVGRLQCQTGLIINILIANFNPENPRTGMPKSRDFRIPGLIP